MCTGGLKKQVPNCQGKKSTRRKNKCLVVEEKKKQVPSCRGKKKASALLPRKKKASASLPRKKKVSGKSVPDTPPTMINGSSLIQSTVIFSPYPTTIQIAIL